MRPRGPGTRLGYTLHKPRRRRFHTLPVLVFGIDEQWRADLNEIINITKLSTSEGIVYISWRWWMSFPNTPGFNLWKARRERPVTDAFKKILRAGRGRKPINLLADDGKEFYNKTFQDLIKRKGIHHFSTSGDTKTSVAERFNRTLRKKMYLSILPRRTGWVI